MRLTIGPGSVGGGGDLDPAVRDRVKRELKKFNDTLDAAVASPTAEALDQLYEAADQLMRAAGRVLIEIERLRSQRQNSP